MNTTPLVFSCPTCEGQLSVPAEMAGVTGPCPYCGSEITAPSPEPAIAVQQQQQHTAATAHVQEPAGVGPTGAAVAAQPEGSSEMPPSSNPALVGGDPVTNLPTGAAAAPPASPTLPSDLPPASTEAIPPAAAPTAPDSLFPPTTPQDLPPAHLPQGSPPLSDLRETEGLPPVESPQVEDKDSTPLAGAPALSELFSSPPPSTASEVSPLAAPPETGAFPSAPPELGTAGAGAPPFGGDAPLAGDPFAPPGDPFLGAPEQPVMHGNGGGLPPAPGSNGGLGGLPAPRAEGLPPLDPAPVEPAAVAGMGAGAGTIGANAYSSTGLDSAPADDPFSGGPPSTTVEAKKSSPIAWIVLGLLTLGAIAAAAWLVMAMSKSNPKDDELLDGIPAADSEETIPEATAVGPDHANLNANLNGNNAAGAHSGFVGDQQPATPLQNGTPPPAEIIRRPELPAGQVPAPPTAGTPVYDPNLAPPNAGNPAIAPPVNPQNGGALGVPEARNNAILQNGQNMTIPQNGAPNEFPPTGEYIPQALPLDGAPTGAGLAPQGTNPNVMGLAPAANNGAVAAPNTGQTQPGSEQPQARSGNERHGNVVGIETMSPEALEALETLQTFLSANNWQERLPFIQDGNEQKLEIQNHYANNFDGPIAARTIALNAVKQEAADRTFVIFVATTETMPGGFPIYLEKQGAEPYRVAWRPFVEFNNDLLAKFLQGGYTEEPQTFHVIMRRAHYLAEDVPDLSSKMSFRIEPPMPDRSGFAFVDADSNVGRTLSEKIGWNLQAFPVVQLRWERGNNGEEFVKIISIPRFGWSDEAV